MEAFVRSEKGKTIATEIHQSSTPGSSPQQNSPSPSRGTPQLQFGSTNISFTNTTHTNLLASTLNPASKPYSVAQNIHYTSLPYSSVPSISSMAEPFIRPYSVGFAQNSNQRPSIFVPMLGWYPYTELPSSMGSAIPMTTQAYFVPQTTQNNSHPYTQTIPPIAILTLQLLSNKTFPQYPHTQFLIHTTTLSILCPPLVLVILGHHLEREITSGLTQLLSCLFPCQKWISRASKEKTPEDGLRSVNFFFN